MRRRQTLDTWQCMYVTISGKMCTNKCNFAFQVELLNPWMQRPQTLFQGSGARLVCSTSLMASLIRSVGGLSKCFYQGLWVANLTADVIGRSINRPGVAYSLFHPLLTPRIISYPLFADADTGIYPHAASQYHARPKAKRGITMLSVDKFPYPRQQTRGNEFIPCSNNTCDMLRRFRSFKIPAITLIWPKSLYKHSVTRSNRSGKESGRRSESPLWRHQWHSFVFISHADDVKREIRLHISRLLTNQKRESAQSMG